MIREIETLSFFEWLPDGLVGWLFILLCVLIVGVVIGWLVAALRHGPITALRMVGRTLWTGVIDLAGTSPRRVLALSWLAVKESIRRRVLVAFGVFILILLFAGWFLDPASAHPGRLYLNFVLTATSYLVLLLALFLSAMSLPADFKNKTLHTVVTKPVRPGEIVLGRVFGFTAVGSVLLVVMGVVSYVFVIRGLSHTHQVSEADFEKGRTDRVQAHRHEISVDASGTARVEMAHGHWHDLTVEQSADKTVYRLGAPRGRPVARVPIYGTYLRFRDPQGKETEKGVNVGDEWMYRSFIRGGSLAAAVWTFEGITEENFPRDQFANGLPLEMTLEVFRTYKGKTDDPEQIPGVVGSLALGTTTDEIVRLEAEVKRVRRKRDRYGGTDPDKIKNLPEPDTLERARYQREVDRIRARLEELRAELPEPIDVKIFKAKDFATDVQYIPLQCDAKDGRKLDLFKDLAPNGRLEVWLRCLEPMQYYGVAQSDVYFRAKDASFAVNLAKGYVGIWLQMIVVIGIGVMFSTFLSGPIGILATVGAVIPKLFCPQLLAELATGQAVGGGPLESLYRLVTQENMVTELQPGLKTTVIEMLDDHVFVHGMRVAVAVLPEFGRFHFADYVAYGFDISGNLVLQCVLQTLAFMVPVFVAGYFFLKMREVAR